MMQAFVNEELARLVEQIVNYPDEMIEFDDVPGVDEVKKAFTSIGIRWNSIVEHDVKRIVAGYEPEYFISRWRYVQRYHSDHNIRIVEEEHEFDSSEKHGYGLSRWLDALQAQSEKFGATLSDYADGMACIHEAQVFYQSDAWKRKASVVRYHCGNRCSTCGVKNVPLHAHHETPIVSAYNRNFHVNFGDERLRTLCEKCHREFHEQSVRGYGYFYKFPASPDEVREEKEQMRLRNKAHDIVRICPHCYGYRSGWESEYAYWGLEDHP